VAIKIRVMTINIELPYRWKPRSYQRRAVEAFNDGVRRLALVYHRRAGKDEIAMRMTVNAAHERIGSYYHCAPTITQGKRIIWNAINPRTNKRRLYDALPELLIEKENGTDLRVKMTCGSQWYVTGSDNYNSLVGESGLGYVFSEWALADPRAWAFTQPIIEENGGYAFFVYTPRGKNHGYSTLQALRQDPDAFTEILTVDDTGVFKQDQLDRILTSLKIEYGDQYGQALFEQEYYCSFDAAVMGTVYGEFIARAEREGRLVACVSLYDPFLPVHTAWDLGFGDSTSIWFFQETGGEIRLIDFHENHGQAPAYYTDFLKKKARERFFIYGDHFLPHDAANKLLAAGGKSIYEQFAAEGVHCKILPSTSNANYIAATRSIFGKFWFDLGRVEEGLNRLRDYKYKYNEKTKVFSSEPDHNYASHAADAFKLIAQRYEIEKIKPKEQLSPAALKARQINTTVGVNDYGR
jgi:phage terminase large subunit